HARRRGLTPSLDNLAKSADQDTNGNASTAETSPDQEAEDTADGADTSAIEPSTATKIPEIQSNGGLGPLPIELEEGFPMEGKYESHLEWQTCRYKTKPREETFCTITLAVPQVSSTTLNACFDGIFKTEYIDDFKCEMCRLVQTKANLEHDMAKSPPDTFTAQAHDSLAKLQFAIDTDPEHPPENVNLRDMRYAPKRKIAKTTRMS
ncbi:hypothetical protein PC129_g25237, partial [Phytophthora cactorum]